MLSTQDLPRRFVTAASSALSLLSSLRQARSDGFPTTSQSSTRSAHPEEPAKQFVNGHDEYRNQRFKIVNRIVKGPWMVKTIGDHSACLLGKALTVNYHKEPKYLEINADIASSTITTAILHATLEAQEEELPESACLLGKALTVNYHKELKYLEINADIASSTITTTILHATLEAQEEELPERLISTMRVCQMEMPDMLPSTSSLVVSLSIEDLTAERTREWFTMTKSPFRETNGNEFYNRNGKRVVEEEVGLTRFIFAGRI
ncbi:unnamed protein product, partial [Linum tenue]